MTIHSSPHKLNVFLSKTSFGIRNLNFWLVILLTFFDLSNSLKVGVSHNVLKAQKKFQRTPKNEKKVFLKKGQTNFFFQQTNLASVKLMGTYCTGICLRPSLLIYQFMNRGVHFQFVMQSNEDLQRK